jgi:hypothetical protein
MGLDYEEYARELRRVELENEAKGEYENEDIQNINQQPEEPQNVDINLKENRRGQQREMPKQQQQAKDEWADDDIDE